MTVDTTRELELLVSLEDNTAVVVTSDGSKYCVQVMVLLDLVLEIVTDWWVITVLTITIKR